MYQNCRSSLGPVINVTDIKEPWNLKLINWTWVELDFLPEKWKGILFTTRKKNITSITVKRLDSTVCELTQILSSYIQPAP